MVFESLVKFAKNNGLTILSTKIVEESKFGFCKAIKPNGFEETFHYNKNTFSWY